MFGNNKTIWIVAPLLLTVGVFILWSLTKYTKQQNDTEAWVHRGMQFYEQGKCPEAIAALYHASVKGDLFADKLLGTVLGSKNCR